MRVTGQCLFAAFLALVTLAGCGGGGGRPASQASYFPLAEANKWSYHLTVYVDQSSASKRALPSPGLFRLVPAGVLAKMAPAQSVDLVSTVLGSAIIEGESYWALESEMLETGETGIQNMRSDHTGIYRYEQLGEQGGDVPVLKLPPTVGDTWTMLGDENITYTTEATNESVTVPAGSFRCVRVRQVDSTVSPAYTIVTWFAYGVGLVQDNTLEGDTLTSEIGLVSYELH